jgi:tRNA A-37 threonylcarbamoyl transferase component Bud32
VDGSEQALTGGNATAGVVRSGSTVRKPWSASTPAVIRLMTAVRSEGVDVPQHFGRDDRGRQVIEYVPGTMAEDLGALSIRDLGRAGALVRRIHDTSADVPLDDVWGEPLLPAPGVPELICHNDLTPWNLVTGERWVFIDWDGAGPSTRLWDLAYSAQAFAGVAEGADPVVAAARLRAFIDGYGADPDLRRALPSVLAPRAAAMHDMLRDADREGIEPWGTMYREGHGAFWRGVSEYAAAHEDEWARALN